MASPASPAETRAYILERLIGDSGDASNVIAAAQPIAEAALPLIQKRLVAAIGAPVTADLRAIEVARVGQAREGAGDHFAMTVVPSPLSPDAMTLVMDAQAIAIAVSGMFGGDLGMPVAAIARALSPIERDVASRMLQEVAAALNECASERLNLTMPVPPATTGAEAARRVMRDGPAVRITFGLSTALDTGMISVVIPQRLLLGQGGAAERRPQESGAWRSHFSEEVRRTTVPVTATMPLARMTLGDLAALQVGQVIELSDAAQTEVQLAARGQTLFVCEFGKLGRNYTVRVRQPFDAGQDFLEGLLRA